MLVLVISGGLAYVLHFALIHGFYYIFIVPALAALIVAGFELLAISRGHCRSRVAAILLGVIAGLFLYLGHYYVGMIELVGPRSAFKLALLPRYIALRMSTQSTDDEHVAGRRQANQPAGQPNVQVVIFDDKLLVVQKSDREGFNWFTFVLEFGTVLLITIGVVRFRGRKPYCEACHDWTKQDLAFLPAGNGRAVADALGSGALTWVAQMPAAMIGPNAAYTALAVEYCPSVEGQASPCPVYFSVKEVSRGGGVGQLNQFDAAFGKMLVRRRALTSQELAALGPKFPSLALLTGKSGAPLSAPPLLQQRETSALADIRPIEHPFDGKILTKRTILLGNFLTLSPFLVALGGVAAAVTGACWWSSGDDSKEILLYASMIGIGVVLAIGGGYFGFRNASFFSLRYIRSLARREIRMRPNPLVNPDDPETIFVDIVPRSHWGKMMLETASDVGFLLVDEARGELRFEGDRENCRIPGPAIISCEVEEIVYGQGTQGSLTIYPTVVRARHSSGIWEAPFVPRGDISRLAADQRLERAREIRDKILSIVPISSNL
jgi:hypothetical protein